MSEGDPPRLRDQRSVIVVTGRDDPTRELDGVVPGWLEISSDAHRDGGSCARGRRSAFAHLRGNRWNGGRWRDHEGVWRGRATPAQRAEYTRHALGDSQVEAESSLTKRPPEHERDPIGAVSWPRSVDVSMRSWRRGSRP